MCPSLNAEKRLSLLDLKRPQQEKPEEEDEEEEEEMQHLLLPSGGDG